MPDFNVYKNPKITEAESNKQFTVREKEVDTLEFCPIMTQESKLFFIADPQ